MNHNNFLFLQLHKFLVERVLLYVCVMMEVCFLLGWTIYYCRLGIQVENEKQLIPLQVLQDNEDVWISNINRKSTAKSTRK